MKYLVTGVNGQLGYDVVKLLKLKGEQVLGLSRKEMDITNKEQVLEIFKEYKPDVVFHCAAYTNVDGAEDDIDDAIKTNVVGTRNIAIASDVVRAKIFYISTDYVFDGKKDGLYEVNNFKNPLSVYGQTKYRGEEYIRQVSKYFIVRTSWVFGINGKNFVKTMLNLSKTRNEVSVVSDQYGSPTYTVDLASLLYEMSKTEEYGTYHANNEGYCNWAEFAEYIFKSNNKDVKVNHIKTEDYPTKAKRPKNSKLSKQSLIDNGFNLLPDWQNAIDRYNLELENEKKLTKSL